MEGSELGQQKFTAECHAMMSSWVISYVSMELISTISETQ